jgi:hypothetical protein
MAADRRFKPVLWNLLLDGEARAWRQMMLARLDRLTRSPPRELPQARGLEETSANAPPTYLLHRGDYSARGPEVAPAFPTALCAAGSDSGARPRPSSRSTGRRTALADWLLRPENPLTARVIVNRIWQHHFGRGLVATPSDFGTMGEEPTHPELLDWLATELLRCGWSLKTIHRLIVTSAAYQQSSRVTNLGQAIDPENTLLGRQNRQRLDGEAIRDALLAVSGRLNQAMGGPSVFPELPPELAKLSSKGAVWPVSRNREDRERRSLYVFVRRNLRYPFFEVFDRPDTNVSCPRRPVTTIAPQALTLLNSRLSHDAARDLAARAAAESGPARAEQAERIALLALGRAPDSAERMMMSQFLEQGGSLSHLALALLNASAFVYVD